MRRAFLLCLAVAVFTWLEFQFYPGHSYLQGDTQLYVPMLERLEAPGFLSRDLVATHPNLAYTIYDELTLFLHGLAHLDFQTALTAQQILCRAAAISGVFLLAVSTGAGDVLALLIAALINLGASLVGPEVFLVDREPVPGAFAFALILFAAGLIAREKPMLAGLMGGIALVYDATIAAPFWIALIAAFLFDLRLRRLIRPALPVLLVFILLLANLAQLQPGTVERPEFFAKIGAPFANLEMYRTKFVWVSLWAGAEVWHYLAILVCGLWATTRIWPRLNRQARWLFLVLPLLGILSVPVSALLLDHFSWSLIPQIQPARALLYTVAFAAAACAIAGLFAARSRKFVEAWLWFLPVLALPINVRFLQFSGFHKIAMTTGLSCVAAALIVRIGLTRWNPLLLFVPLAAIAAISLATRSETPTRTNRQAILEVADWGERETWGSSLFLFPDAGREIYPGIFRAASRRSLWIDWYSGRLIPYFESFAAEWWQRWHDDMLDGFTPQRLESMLPLPVDYYVLKRSHELENVRPVFRNREFVVYDATDLRNAPEPLKLARAPQ